MTPEEECREQQDMVYPRSRVMFCSRCGHAAGSYQAHYWKWCRVDSTVTEFHICCPGSCSLIDGKDMNPIAPCHPDPGTYKEWAALPENSASPFEPEGISVWKFQEDKANRMFWEGKW